MSLGARVLPFFLIAALLVAACADAPSPTQVSVDPASPIASKGSGGGGGGGGGSTTLVITTAPTADASGTWTGTSDGPDITHTTTRSACSRRGAAW